MIDVAVEYPVNNFPVQLKIGEEFFSIDRYFAEQHKLLTRISTYITRCKLTENDIEYQEFLRYITIDKSRKYWYSEYKNKSAGRVIHFIYVYSNLRLAEIMQIGSGEVIYANEVIMTYTWQGNMPVFKLADNISFQEKDLLNFLIKNQTIYHKYLRLEKEFGIENDVFNLLEKNDV